MNPSVWRSDFTFNIPEIDDLEEVEKSSNEEDNKSEKPVKLRKFSFISD